MTSLTDREMRLDERAERVSITAPGGGHERFERRPERAGR
jgi:hypothetical protein